ncbi:hypothetical protein GOBAR_AA15080 [Gossypium barbadense]|uniref:Uncharacterized protein n=1 Tax=Gossypium barbadense TaxID=3634 RepID=A0A2P5XQE4_GOSBA|nr:hypothetical protein GOBAR_AA15080 [Gossypium barbadense]
MTPSRARVSSQIGTRADLIGLHRKSFPIFSRACRETTAAFQNGATNEMHLDIEAFHSIERKDRKRSRNVASELLMLRVFKSELMETVPVALGKVDAVFKECFYLNLVPPPPSNHRSNRSIWTRIWSVSSSKPFWPQRHREKETDELQAQRLSWSNDRNGVLVRALMRVVK